MIFLNSMGEVQKDEMTMLSSHPYEERSQFRQLHLFTTCFNVIQPVA
jgi:hypothetical protein